MAGLKSDREVLHAKVWRDMVGNLPNQSGARRFQLRFDAEIHGAVSGTIQPLPANLPGSTKAHGGRHEETIENQLDWETISALRPIMDAHREDRAGETDHRFRNIIGGQSRASDAKLRGEIPQWAALVAAPLEVSLHLRSFLIGKQAASEVRPLVDCVVLHHSVSMTPVRLVS
jgi:hypothetical protein